MDYIFDLNNTDGNLNNPIYCVLPKKRAYGQKEKIHRIPGKDEILESDIILEREKYLSTIELSSLDSFDHQGMLFVNKEEEKVVLTQDTNPYDFEVFGSAHRFCVVFPASYLKADAMNLFDIINGSNNLPDSYAYKTTQLLQILFFLFSEDGIERTWSGVLPSDKKKQKKKKKNNNPLEPPQEGGGEEDEDDEPPNPMLQPDENRYLKGVYHREGEPSDVKFSLLNSHITGQNQRIVYDRVLIDFVTVSKSGSQKVHRVNKRTFDPGNVLFQEDVECFLFVFTIVDPYVNVPRGLFRSIQINQEALKEANKKKKVKSGPAADKIDYRVDDTDSYIWDLRCINAIEKIFKIEDFIDILGVATSHPIRFKQEFDNSTFKNQWFKHSNIFNVVNVLNIEKLDSNPWYLWDGVFKYNNLNRVEEEKLYIKDSDFLLLPDLNWENQKHRVAWYTTAVKGEYREDEEGGVMEETEVENVVESAVRLHFYPYPNRVIRYSSHHIDPYLVGSTLIPCYINSDRQGVNLRTEGRVLPTRNRRFPTLNSSQASQMQLNLKTLKQKLMNKQALTERIVYCSADTIRGEVYKVARGERDHTAKLPAKTDFAEKMHIAYDLVTRTMKGDSPNLSPSMAAVIKFVENEQALDEKFTIFPDIYSPEFGFEFYEGFTLLSNAMINMNHLFLDLAEALRHSHSNMWRILLLSPYPGFLRFGFQPTIGLFGDHGSGKSTLFQILTQNSIPGITKRVDSTTKQATNTITSNAGMINIMDESDVNAPFVTKTGNEMDVNGEWKTKRTEGVATREVQERSVTEKRVTIAIESDARTLDIWGGNLKYRDLPPSARDRVDIQMLLVSGRLLTVSKLNYIKMSYNQAVIARHKKNFMKIIQGFQIFVYYIGYLSHAGALAYNPQMATFIVKVMNERGKKALDGVMDLKTDKTYNARFESDRLPILVECIMLFRIYISICSGVVPFVKPKEVFSVEKLKEVADSGLLYANEDDYVMGLSFFDQLFSFAELRAFALYCEKRFSRIRRKNGTFKYVSGSPPSTWDKEPFYSDNEVYPDYNELNLAAILHLPAFEQIKDEDVLKCFADEIAKDYYEINRDLLKEQLVTLTTTHIDYQYHESIAEKYSDPLLSGAENKEAHRSGPILNSVKIKVGNKFLTSFTLKREWLDKMVRNQFGPMHNLASYSHPGFLGGALETALQFCNYEGMTKRKVVLPGMMLNRVVPGNPAEVREMPHIFKTLQFGKPIRNDPPPTLPGMTAETYHHDSPINGGEVRRREKKIKINKEVSVEDYAKLKIPTRLHYIGDGGKNIEVLNLSPGNPLKDPSSIFFARNLEFLQKFKLGERFEKEAFVKELKREGGWVQGFSPVALENRFTDRLKGVVKKPYYETYIPQELKYGAENTTIPDQAQEVDFDQMFL